MLGQINGKWLAIGAVVGVIVFTKVLPKVAPGLKAKIG